MVPSYRVIGSVTISIHTKIEAADEEQAREVAADQEMGNIDCHADPWIAWVAEELDGTPCIIEIEEIHEAPEE